MKIHQYTLNFYVGCFFLFSVPAFFFPEWFALTLGYQLDQRGALMEFVGAYGGLILGVGLYLIYCLKHNVKAGLVCVLTVIASLFGGRLVGYFMEQAINNVQMTFLVIELITIALVSGLLYFNEPQSMDLIAD